MDVTIIELNINSIIVQTCRHDFELFLDKPKPHIVLLYRIRLHYKYKPNFSNFNLFRADRSQSNHHFIRGGIASLIAEKLLAYQYFLPANSFKSLEITLVVL